MRVPGMTVETQPAILDARVCNEGAALELALGDGRRLPVSAETLWRECPSAQGKARRMKGETTPPQGLRIVALNAIGHYALNIAFSDGHDRGVYPWDYLLSLARRPTMEDFISAA